MYQIVLAADPDVERAKAAADAILTLPGPDESVNVTILDVFEEFDVADAGGRVSSDEVFNPENYSDGAVAAKRALEDISHELQMVHGEPADRILAVAADLNADLIVLSGTNRSPTGKAVFGSVAQSVLLSADRPVMVAKHDSDGG